MFRHSVTTSFSSVVALTALQEKQLHGRRRITSVGEEWGPPTQERGKEISERGPDCKGMSEAHRHKREKLFREQECYSAP